MSEIRTIFFDIGGVLLTNGWGRNQRASVFQHFQVDSAEFERRHPALNDEWERGNMTVQQYLGEALFYQPRPFSIDEFLAAMKQQSQWLPGGAINILRALYASRQYGLVMLNNEAKELNDYRIQQFGLDKVFSTFVSSCYVGLRKPEEKIFHVALDLTQADPAHSVFIDDRENNVTAARAAGFHAIQYTDEAQLQAALKALGVAVELPAG